MKKMKPKKTAGADQISAFLVKVCASVLAYPLQLFLMYVCEPINFPLFGSCLESYQLDQRLQTRHPVSYYRIPIQEFSVINHNPIIDKRIKIGLVVLVWYKEIFTAAPPAKLSPLHISKKIHHLNPNLSLKTASKLDWEFWFGTNKCLQSNQNPSLETS